MSDTIKEAIINEPSKDIPPVIILPQSTNTYYFIFSHILCCPCNCIINTFNNIGTCCVSFCTICCDGN